MEQLFTDRKFHFCYHRNFRVFLVNGKRPTSPRGVYTWARDMIMGYWSVAIPFWQLSFDHIVNVLYWSCGLAKIRLRHPSLPFDSLPYPTRTICRRVRTYVRSVNHVTTKRKEVDHIPWSARGSPAMKDYRDRGGCWPRLITPSETSYLVPVRRLFRPSQSMYFGDVSETNGRETPRQSRSAHAWAFLKSSHGQLK